MQVFDVNTHECADPGAHVVHVLKPRADRSHPASNVDKRLDNSTRMKPSFYAIRVTDSRFAHLGSIAKLAHDTYTCRV